MLSLNIGDAIKGIAGIIDNLNVSDEERAQAKAKLLKIENDLSSKVIDYESVLAKARRDVLVSETKSQSWIARNWRPILMLSITFMLIHQYIMYPYLHPLLSKFGLDAIELPEELFYLLTVGVGGYVVGRSGEKIAKTIRATPAQNTVLPGDVKAERKEFESRAKEFRKLTKIARKMGWSEAELDERLKLLRD